MGELLGGYEPGVNLGDTEASRLRIELKTVINGESYDNANLLTFHVINLTVCPELLVPCDGIRVGHGVKHVVTHISRARRSILHARTGR